MARNDLGQFLPGTSGNAGGSVERPLGWTANQNGTGVVAPCDRTHSGNCSDSDDERVIRLGRRPARSSIAV